MMPDKDKLGGFALGILAGANHAPGGCLPTATVFEVGEKRGMPLEAILATLTCLTILQLVAPDAEHKSVTITPAGRLFAAETEKRFGITWPPKKAEGGSGVSNLYRGMRSDDGTALVLVDDRQINPRSDLWNHSPAGLECGCAGRGPAQLALAILADCLGDGELAVRLHQFFKRDVVAKLPRENWILTRVDVEEWVKNFLELPTPDRRAAFAGECVCVGCGKNFGLMPPADFNRSLAQCLPCLRASAQAAHYPPRA